MKRLVVNADDFGLSAGITQGILEAHAGGIVTSTSIVASGQWFDEAVEAAKKHPDLGVGIHLTLIEEKPVSDPSRLPTLTNRGVFPASFGGLISGVLSGRIRKLEIETELCAQIEKCLAAGLKITHLDSHQHVHALPAIFRMAVNLARAYGITAIRVPRDRPKLHEVTGERFLAKSGLCGLAWLDAKQLRGLHTSNHFAGLFESGDLTEERLLRIVERLEDGTTELVCHPAREDDTDSNTRYGHWNYHWGAELAALTSRRVRQALERHEVKLVSYTNLAASG